MKNKYYFLPVIIAIMFIIAGCGGGGGTANNHPEIVQFLNNFKGAVEAYDVTKMLNCLTDTGFQLTITEAGLSYNKNKDTLTTELNDDKDNQLAWRKSTTEDPVNGHGYVLELILNTPSYSNETGTGAIVSQSFAVYESATSPSIPRMKTDNGTITWQLAKISGTWKAVAMSIEYQALSGSGLKLVGSIGGSRGFGFAKFSL